MNPVFCPDTNETCSTYEEYLRSNHWMLTRARFRKSPLSAHGCLVCGNPKFDVHHRTYERIGREHISDLISLCRVHHKRVHLLIGRDRSKIRKAVTKFIRKEDKKHANNWLLFFEVARIARELGGKPVDDGVIARMLWDVLERKTASKSKKLRAALGRAHSEIRKRLAASSPVSESV